MRTLLAILAGIVLGFAFVSAALAAGNTSSYPPPEAIKYKGKAVQQTELYYYRWTYFTDGGEWATEGPWKASRYDWPQADRVAAGSRVNVVIRFKDKPDLLKIRRYGSVYANGGPRGSGTAVQYKLYPVKRVPEADHSGGVSKWAAYFKLPAGDHRIVIRTGWNHPGKGYFHSYGVETRLAHLKAY